MEAIAKIPGRETKDIGPPTLGAFLPLLEKQRAVMEAVPRKTFEFGPHARNKIDVYYPSTAPADGNAKTPVLFWLYGGGYSAGDRSLAVTKNLLFGNIGAFYSQRGFIVVIPDYRLVPEVVFPASAEDVRDAMLWIIKNASTTLVSSTSQNPDVDNLIVMGHSAGAVHAATLLFHPGLLPVDGSGPEGAKELRQRLRAVVLVSGPHEPIDVVPEPQPGTYSVHTAYWEWVEGARLNLPRPLYERAPEELLTVLPHILIVAGEWEPDWIAVGQPALRDAFLKREGRKVEMVILPGHNHISIPLALMSGEGEEWAENVAKWYKGLPARS